MADENKRANTRAVKSRQQNVTRKIVINEHVIYMEKKKRMTQRRWN